MKKILSGFVISAILMSCGGDKKDADMAMGKDTTMAATTETPKAMAATELLDMSRAEPVKKGMMAFANRDIEGMTAEYADTVNYTWSSGDTLMGKQSVKNYYNGRLKLIDSLNYSEFILLPIKVNETQSKMAPNGDWVLAWAFAHVKYKNGKKLNFWVHQVNHYNTGGKIDFVGQYLDRAPINAATMGMKK